MKRRPAHIVAWERTLVDEGTTIVKVFLNVSKDEQRKRLQERLDDPEKRWKFRKSDLDVRARFDDYIAAYDEVIAQTSTKHAPWYVVPADHNWVKATAVAELLVAGLERIDPQLPEPEDGLEGLSRREACFRQGCRARVGATAPRRPTTSTMSTETAWAISTASPSAMPHSASASNRACTRRARSSCSFASGARTPRGIAAAVLPLPIAADSIG